MCAGGGESAQDPLALLTYACRHLHVCVHTVRLPFPMSMCRCVCGGMCAHLAHVYNPSAFPQGMCVHVCVLLGTSVQSFCLSPWYVYAGACDYAWDPPTWPRGHV